MNRRKHTLYTLGYIIFTLSFVATEKHNIRDVRATPEIFKTLNDFIEERARQRFLEHWQRLHVHKNTLQGDEITGHAFSYHTPLYNNLNHDQPITFAVAPSDPRFYDSISDSHSPYSQDSKQNEDQIVQKNPNIVLPPSPQDIKPKLPINIIQTSVSNDIEEEQISDDTALPRRISGVIQKPVEMNGAITVYIIALIGGISAAVTVGLVSIIIGWYTLFKRAKAAADVEYPAYGVTGPNKESSPTIDQKMEKHAEIYHFQQQKQHIISMEHRNHTNTKTKLFEVETQDDNEEGDYTVYECPGLAPTGEMEVKNPLFLEDSTIQQNKNEI